MFKDDKVVVDALDLVLTVIEVLDRTLVDSEGGFESQHVCLLNFINHY
jgi:hypothetical protein